MNWGLVLSHQCCFLSVVVKEELSRKAKFSIHQSVYIPTLTYDHEVWIMTESIQAIKLIFLLQGGWAQP